MAKNRSVTGCINILKYIASMASFGLGVLFGGLLLAYLKIYELKDIDPKFIDAPGMAFQLEIFGLVFQIVVGSIIFVLGLIVKRYISRKITPKARYGYLSFIFGAVHALIMYWVSDIRFYPGLILIICLPLIFAWLLPLEHHH